MAVLGICYNHNIPIVTLQVGNLILQCCVSYTVNGFIFMGTNFRGLYKNDTFVGFKIRGHSTFFNN